MRFFTALDRRSQQLTSVAWTSPTTLLCCRFFASQQEQMISLDKKIITSDRSYFADLLALFILQILCLIVFDDMRIIIVTLHFFLRLIPL